MRNLTKAMLTATVLTVGANADFFQTKESNAQLGYNQIVVSTDGRDITASGVALHLNTKRVLERAPSWSMLTTIDFGYSSTSDLNGYANTATNNGNDVLMDIGIGLGVGYEPVNDLTISLLGSVAMIAQGDFYWWGPEGGANVTYELGNWTLNARYLVGSMRLESAASVSGTVSTSRMFAGVGYKF